MPRLIYLFDPLCGWCYGAAPALRALGGGGGLELLPTGLFAGAGARRMDAQFAAHAWSNDQRIAQQTRQPFTEAYRRNALGTGAAFDSGPANAALTAVHLDAPERELEALHAIQQARFVEGRDITERTVLAAILEKLGQAGAARRLLGRDVTLDAETLTRTRRGRALMQELGARGVPRLVRMQGETQQLLPGQILFTAPSDPLAALEAA